MKYIYGKVCDRLSSVYSVAFNCCCSTLYNEGQATVPKLAEKLTIELVEHIEVSFYFHLTLTINCINYELLTSVSSA